MKFRITIPGQPPSTNHSYRVIRIKHRDGSSHQQLGKVPGLETYQVMVSALVQRAKPPDWNPPGQIRVRYWFHVQRDIDCDNALKAINDAIAIGMGTEVKGKRVVPIWNDKLFLPCVVHKTTGNPEPYVEVEVDDERLSVGDL